MSPPFEPLSDTVVLDLTRLLPGAYCTRLLCEYGAEVVKIEEPTDGDYARNVPPFNRGSSQRHVMDNFDKLSVGLDLKSDAGVSVFKDLIQSADVVVENFRPGVTARLGVDYDTVSSWNENIVYCSITGYGQTGPYRHLPGHDINYTGVAGLVGLTGRGDGPPTVPGGMIADVSAGVHAALGVLAALLEHARTDAGEYVDVSMTDVSMAYVLPYLAQYFATEDPPTRGRGRYLGSPCYDVYEAGDGAYLSLGALEPKFWKNLCEAIDCPDLVPLHLTDDPEEQNHVRRTLESVFARRSRESWLEDLHAADVPVAPVNTVEDVASDPQIKEREMITEVPHPAGGGSETTGHPINYGSDLRPPNAPAPALGEHTSQLLEELGYEEEELAELHRRDIIVDPDRSQEKT